MRLRGVWCASVGVVGRVSSAVCGVLCGGLVWVSRRVLGFGYGCF